MRDFTELKGPGRSETTMCSYHNRRTLLNIVLMTSELGNTEELCAKIRQSKQQQKRFCRDKINQVLNFITNGCTNRRMHVGIEVLIEVSVAVEVPLEDLTLDMLAPL